MNKSIKILMPVLAAGTLVLTGCSATTPATNSDATSTSISQATAPFNDADVTFLQQMYPHHSQAVEMAKMVPTRSTNPQIQALATSIEGAQGPEMDQMVKLLASFGKPAPTAGSMGSGSMGSGSMGSTGSMGSMNGSTGMMSDAQMSNLQTLSGAAFDREWLTLMIAHHTGAVEMATTELAQGSNADAKTLATNIIAAQQKEIALMKTL